MENFNVITVSQLNFYLKCMFDDDQNLKNILIQGEISNFKNHFSSGHIYFSIKDENSLIKCVMFSRYAKSLKFLPKDGMKVLLRGTVSVYESTGQYQVYVYDMYPQGVGELHLAFENLKQKLQLEGLFDESFKKPIPDFPKRIGVITSKSGAVLQDIKNVISRRLPMTQIVLCPVSVQGETASNQMVKAIRLFNDSLMADVLIIARGGGSIEDLWAFNDELLAREIFKSKIPIISAVGHETDFTICDFVSDLRAPTPSAAAELAVPCAEDVKVYLDNIRMSLNNFIFNKISSFNSSLDDLNYKLKILSPMQKIAQQNLELQNLKLRLLTNIKQNLKNNEFDVDMLVSKLQTLNPLDVLNRGYAIAYYGDDILNSINNVNVNDSIKICLTDGQLECIINKKIKNKK